MQSPGRVQKTDVDSIPVEKILDEGFGSVLDLGSVGEGGIGAHDSVWIPVPEMSGSTAPAGVPSLPGLRKILLDSSGAYDGMNVGVYDQERGSPLCDWRRFGGQAWIVGLAFAPEAASEGRRGS